jgi:alanyl-tRNA synthetase
MTERLYYTDSYLRSFDAVVRSCDIVDGRPHVVLDRTAFYPSSGGQSFDTGRLGGQTIVDVIDADTGEVVHVLSGPLDPGAAVHGEIDWPRRFDHMQQHTGQHVLSAAFVATADVATVSFHLGAETATIDLAREVTAAEIATAEAEANRVVWEDREVRVRFVSEDEARALPLRKPPARGGELRLVEIDRFDLSACGGTHVTRTGRIGVVAIAGWERFKGASRITFVCGGRALRAYGALRDAVTAATRTLSVAPAELAGAISRLQDEGRTLGRTVRTLQETVGVYRAAEWRTSAETIGAYRGVLRSDAQWDAATLKAMAAAVVEAPGLVAVLVGGGQPAPVVAARSADVAFDAAAWIRHAAAALGGRGGGRAELAQGGLAAAPEAILALARDQLRQN